MDELQKLKAKEIVKFAIGVYEQAVHETAEKVRALMEEKDEQEALMYLKVMNKKMIGGWRMVQDVIEPAVFMIQAENENPVAEVLGDDEEDFDDTMRSNPIGFGRRARRYRITVPRIRQHGGIFTGGDDTVAGTPQLSGFADQMKSLVNNLEEPKRLGILLDSMQTAEELLKAHPDNELYKKTKEQLSKDIQAVLNRPVLSEVKPLEELESHT